MCLWVSCFSLSHPRLCGSPCFSHNPRESPGASPSVCLTQASLGSGDQIPWGLSGVEEGLRVSWTPVPLFCVHRALFSALTARELCHLPVSYTQLALRSCRRQTGEAVQVGTPTCKSSQGVPGAARKRPGWDKRAQTQPGVRGWRGKSTSATSVSSANPGLWAVFRQVKSLLPTGTLGCADSVFSLEVTLVFVFPTPSKWN